MSDKPKKLTTIGGQALIEGIIMLGPEKAATIVRKSDGKLEIKEEKITLSKTKYPFLGWVFIRGIINLYESMKRGISALNFSASFFDDEEVEESKFDKWINEKFGSEKAEKIAMSIATILGVAVPIVLFIFLPTLLAGTLDKLVGSQIMRNLIEGILRVAVFLIFMYAVSRMKDMKRVFSYHGAEHKTIHCYEAGEDLTPENARKFPKEHPRCGTSFLFSVMIISVIVFSLVSWSTPVIRLVLRLVLLPVVISLSYEINRLIGRYDNFVSRFFRQPGLWFQGFTTFEPDDSMLEVAIAALKRVIPEDSNSDKW